MKNSLLKFGIVFIVLSTLVFIILNYERSTKIELHLENKTKQYEQNYNATYKGYKNLAKVIFETDINSNEVKKIFAQASITKDKEQDIVRKKLYDKLKNTYELLKSYNIKQLHFHLPSNESFLRFHRPNRFGDNLTNVRETIKYSNDNKEQIDGFEEGRIYNGYRFVYPLSYDGKHIGTVEVSFSTLVMSLEMVSNYKVITQFLISKEVVGQKVFDDEKSNYVKSPLEDFYIEKKSAKVLADINNINIAEPLSKKTNKIVKNRGFDNDSFSIYDTYRKNIVTFIKVKNPINRSVVGILVVQSDASYIVNKNRNFYIVMFFSILLITVGLLLIYKELEQKYKFRIEAEKERKINKKLQKLNDEVKESRNEVEKLNEGLELKVKDEVHKNVLAQEKLFKSEKMASMGEMIGNIAHQWRQPLSVISTVASGIQLQQEHKILTDELLLNSCEQIIENTQNLSDIINNFSDFIEKDRERELFSLKSNLNRFMSLIVGSLKHDHINIVLDVDDDDIKIDAYPSELIQCYMNIYNNSNEAFHHNTIDDRVILINVIKDDSKLCIIFQDNAGGIKDDILPKIFEPYFTTKHQSQGKGLGLHMTYNLIVNGMGGTIEASNKHFEYKSKENYGVEVKIILPV
ncbi:MAG: ATP-binding protein [Campylobacterota bacterium]|nr:ATP-binding protein [Campylobacterota bacterium]